MVDIWSEENEPQAHVTATQYLVTLPRTHYRPRNEDIAIYLLVDSLDGSVSIDTMRGNYLGEPTRDHHKDICEWLVEWELAEWKQIGPEDMELFATRELTG